MPNRTLDGVGNNVGHPNWGKTERPFRRRKDGENAYGDGVSTPAGSTRPNPRCISNTVCMAPTSPGQPSRRRLTDFVWAWGQFILHEVSFAKRGSVAFDVPYCTGDPAFPTGTILAVKRNVNVGPAGQPKNQVNRQTSYLDASAVYGADATRATALRVSDGSGKLATSGGGLLPPLNTGALPNDPDDSNPAFFLAGDERANENVALTALHTLFVREHNRLCTALDGKPEYTHATPSTQDDLRYERARKVVGALIQVITYEEFLPALLGSAAIKPYSGYDPLVDATVSNFFASVAFRIGHSMLSTEIAVPSAALPIVDAFFNPAYVTVHGIEPVFLGLAAQIAQEVDPFVVEPIRSQLVPTPRDLVALDLQRARDHGLPDYNTARTSRGLAPKATFADITPDTQIAGRLQTAYGTPALLDPFIGVLAEAHVGGGSVGELARRVIVQQFRRLRDGDRFWYANDRWLFDPNDSNKDNRNGFTAGEIEALRSTRLSEVIKRNCQGCDDLPLDVFRVPEDSDD